MVFISRGRGRGANRGRGRGVGEVAFEPRGPHGVREARQPSESLRITVGNDQFREQRDHSGSPSMGNRRVPSHESYNYDHRHEENLYRREAEAYGHPDRASYERERDYDHRELRDHPVRPEERDFGDRRGLGGSNFERSYEPQSSGYPSVPSQPLFPAGSRSPPKGAAAAHPAQSSRPLKSILKKKSEPVPEETQPSKPSGLPGISSYIDDIEDEDKFLYGDDNRDRRQSGHNIRPDDHYKAHPQTGDMRSAAQSWQPSAPAPTSVAISSANQQNYIDNNTMHQQQYPSNTGYQNQPAQAPPADGDLWSMLAKSVQTVQQQQQQQQHFPAQGQFDSQQDNFQPQFSAQTAPSAVPAQPSQGAQAPGHDPTIENILKSIGFDFEMSKRMQEKAKQGTELPKPPMKPSDSQFGINHTASFIGSEMSHEDMRSHLAPGHEPKAPDERLSDYGHDKSRGNQDMFDFDDRGRSSNLSRERLNSPQKGMSPETERLQRGCSPVSADGSPPPPMFNLPPITIKRRSNIEQNVSPNWDKDRSLSRTPTRDSSNDRNKHRSRSPSWNRNIIGYGGRSSRSPGRKRSSSPADRVKSPIIKRTFNLDALSPIFRRRVSPSRRSLSPGRKRSHSPRRKSRSPGRRSPGRRSRSPGRRSRSPGRRARSPGRRSRSPGRRSRSPGRLKRSPGRRSPGRRSPGRRSPGRWSRSPGRRRSRSPNRRRSRSPRRAGRRNSPKPRGRNRSISPRGRKRVYGSRSRSRERKHRRSSSRDRHRRRSGSPGNIRNSRSPRPRRSVSISSDSDPDGPANKNYFSSPLRLNRKMPPGFNGPPPVDFSVPPSGFVPSGPPPGFPVPGMPPPPGQPPFGMPPIICQPPPSVPLPGYPYVAPNPVMYTASVPPNVPISVPPNVPISVPFESEMVPPGTMEMPLNLPQRPNPEPEVSNDKPSLDKREHESPSSKSDRSDRSGRRESSSSQKSERASTSSNRTVLLPKIKSRDEDSASKSSSYERVVIIGKQAKSVKDTKKVDAEKEKAKLVKEKEIMVNKIKVLEKEFNNLKKQEFDLKARPAKDGKVDPILNENKKLLDEIKKEIIKISKQKEQFEKKHEFLKESAREVKVTPKRPVSDKGKGGDKKEEFKVEKGKMMKHCFIDKGDHWCKPCNTVHSNIQDFIHHLGSYKHKQSLQSDFRPWMDGFQPHDGMILNKHGARVALPGVEFMMPVSAYYCQICKVFLGDVSFAVDHLKCESHYLSYKKYLSQDQFYEKKWKEEREKAVKQAKADKQKDAVQVKAEAKAARKRSDSEKDARIRANEKKWDPSVEDLDDVSEDPAKQKASKSQSQIKLSLKGQSSKTETSVKTKESTNSANSKVQAKSEEKNENKVSEASSEKEKDKSRINFNFSLTGKAIVGKSGPGAAKKNPLLPPWQPVGKKTDSVGKPGDASDLDQFLTTNSGDGKIPIVSDKKKVSAKDVLAAFSDRCKEKEEAAKNQAKAEEEKIAAEIAAEKAKKELLEDLEKRISAIDSEAESALAEEIPLPPASQNVPLPDQKPCATVTSDNVHDIFNSSMEETVDVLDSEDNANDSVLEIPKTEVVLNPEPDLSDIQLPPSLTDSSPIEELPPSNTEPSPIKEVESSLPPSQTKSSPMEELEVLLNPEPDISDIQLPPSQTESNPIEELPSSNTEPSPIQEVEPSSIQSYEDQVNETRTKIELMETQPEFDLVDEQVSDSELNKSDELVNLEMLEAATNEFNTIFDSDLSKNEGIATDDVLGALECISKDDTGLFGLQSTDEIKFDDIMVNMNVVNESSMEIVGSTSNMNVADTIDSDTNDSKDEKKPEHAVVSSDKDNSELSEIETVHELINEENTVTEVKDLKEEEEVEETVEVVTKTRGRGRGKGTRGRGRGSKTAQSAKPRRSTRSTKVVEVSVEITEPEIDKTLVSDNIETDANNKDLESTSSVEVGNTSNNRGKKSSPRVRKSSLKLEPETLEMISSADIDDAGSDISGISMNMGSDFEVVDDLEDMDVLDETM